VALTMDDPIRNHPTRAEQLDIMATAIADLARPGDRVLDLGCGTGYFIHLLEQKRGDLAIIGVDLKAESLAAARERFGEGRFTWVAGDLSEPLKIALPHERYRFVTCGLTFHDLLDVQKQAVIARVAKLLGDDGLYLHYDRIQLTEGALFPVQQSIWRRLERVHGFGMRSAESFAAYEASLGTANDPAKLKDYQRWFDACGLAHTIIHLHGNVAIFAATRRG
jgi:tRNA (cmo5U34)-methyltransferase